MCKFAKEARKIAKHGRQMAIVALGYETIDNGNPQIKYHYGNCFVGKITVKIIRKMDHKKTLIIGYGAWTDQRKEGVYLTLTRESDDLFVVEESYVREREEHIPKLVRTSLQGRPSKVRELQLISP
jgi:hypothetical protein